MKNSISIPLLLLTIGTLARLHAGNLELSPAPTSDGEISWTTVAMEDGTEKVDDLGQGAKVGQYYGGLYTAVFEFALPPDRKTQALIEAKILLSTNTVNPDDQTTPSPVAIEVYGYAGPNADGMVDAKDGKGGELLGLALAKDDEIPANGKIPPIDITDFVRKSLQSGAKYLGIRLQAKDLTCSVKQEGVCIRSTEFGQEFKGNEPKLVLSFED